NPYRRSRTCKLQPLAGRSYRESVAQAPCIGSICVTIGYDSRGSAAWRRTEISCGSFQLRHDQIARRSPEKELHRLRGPAWVGCASKGTGGACDQSEASRVRDVLWRIHLGKRSICTGSSQNREASLSMYSPRPPCSASSRCS